MQSLHYAGDEYLLVESKPGLGFHPEQFGIFTEKLHTACLRGFVGTFAIRDGGLFLDPLEVLAQDGPYPEINGVPPACRGGLVHAPPHGLQAVPPPTTKFNFPRANTALPRLARCTGLRFSPTDTGHHLSRTPPPRSSTWR